MTTQRSPTWNRANTFIIISYDISDNRRRTKLMKLLKNYGERVQYSVFECILSATQLKNLRQNMLPLLQLREDSVRFYFLPGDPAGRIEVLGVGVVAEDPIIITV